jgi:hypothetical protein
MIRNKEDEKETFYELFKGVNTNLQIDRNEWEQFRKRLGLLEDKQLEQVKEGICSFIMENPVVLHHVLYKPLRLAKSW